MGVGGILVFLPQVALLFFFLAMMEDSGYISRVAFMTDGIYNAIIDVEMIELLKQGKSGEYICDLADNRWGKDNATLVYFVR